MLRVEFDRNAPLAAASGPGSMAAAVTRWALLVLTLFAFGYASLLELKLAPPLPRQFSAEGICLLLSFIATIVWHARTLPLENVLLASVIIGALSGLIAAVGALSGIPFGAFSYTEAAGPGIGRTLPFAIPVLWIVALLNARGVARLILRRARHRPNYGLWVIGLTGVLMIGFAMGLDPYANGPGRYWVWQANDSIWTWYGAPWITFPVWGMVSVLILVFAVPSLINKKPGRQPADLFPLLLWSLLLLLLTTGLSARELLGAAMLSGSLLMVSFTAAVTGLLVSKRRPPPAA